MLKVTINITPGAQYSSFFQINSTDVYLPKTKTDDRVDVSSYFNGDAITTVAADYEEDNVRVAVLPEGKYEAGQNLFEIYVLLDYSGNADRLCVQVPSSGDIHDLLCTTGTLTGSEGTAENVPVEKELAEAAMGDGTRATARCMTKTASCPQVSSAWCSPSQAMRAAMTGAITPPQASAARQLQNKFFLHRLAESSMKCDISRSAFFRHFD